MKCASKPLFLIMMIIASTATFAQVSTSTSVTTTTPEVSGSSNAAKPTQTTTYTITTSTMANSVDDDIVSGVYAKYANDPALIGTALNVSCQNGIVTISGTVTAQAQADEASIAAKSVSGVKDVRSEINVTTNPNLNKKPITPNY